MLLLLLSTGLSAQLIGDSENGLASYYSREYDGAETAYGQVYRRGEMVAAHKSFPENSIVEVINLDNRKSVRVRIIDKGPFIRGRVIEVSEAAAKQLGMIGKVTVPVEINLRSLNARPPVKPQPQPEPVVRKPSPEPKAEIFVAVSSTPKAGAPTPPKPSPAAAPAPKTEPAPTKAVTSAPQTNFALDPKQSPAAAQKTDNATTGADAAATLRAKTFGAGIYKVELRQKPVGKFGVQVASYRDLETAMEKVAELQSQWFKDILIERVPVTEGSIFKVILGPFPTEEESMTYVGNLKRKYGITGFAVQLEK